jgi:hypothetical protein
VVFALLRQAPHRLPRAGVAAHLLVQSNINVRGVEVRPDGLEEVLGVLADVQVGAVAHGVLAGVDALVVRLLLALGRADVAHLLEAKGHRVVGPHVHAVAQDGVERLGHVEIAHAAAGNARGARADAGLIKHNHVGAAAAPALPELHGQVPGAAQAVDARAEDDVLRCWGQGGHGPLLCGCAMRKLARIMRKLGRL